MEDKIVNYNTELICKSRYIQIRRKPYLFLKETLKKFKNKIYKKSWAAHPCQNYFYLKEAKKKVRTDFN